MTFALIPGLGHIYVGRFWGGVVIFLLVMFTFGLGIPLWIWSIFDARYKARLYNAKVLKEIAEQYDLLYI
jgi:TM2 domain-containing membrane protein YozV